MKPTYIEIKDLHSTVSSTSQLASNVSKKVRELDFVRVCESAFYEIFNRFQERVKETTKRVEVILGLKVLSISG